jgi:hypothetical protein
MNRISPTIHIVDHSLRLLLRHGSSPQALRRGKPNNAVTGGNLCTAFFNLKASEVPWVTFVANVPRFATICWSAGMGQTGVADVSDKNDF